MICAPCARAADEQLDETEHCDDPGGPSARCTCQHRAGRYGTAFRRPAVPQRPVEVTAP